MENSQIDEAREFGPDDKEIQVLSMLCPLCSIEVAHGEENCPECGTYLVTESHEESFNGTESSDYEENITPFVFEEDPESEAPLEAEVTSSEGPSEGEDDERADGNAAETNGDDIDAEMAVIKKKMKKARLYYRNKKMPNKKYMRLIKGYKKKLHRLKEMKQSLKMPVEEEEETPQEMVVEEMITQPQVDHRSQLNTEDLYMPIQEDQSWIDPLLITEYETATRDCPNCGDLVRTHWIVCPACRSDL